MADPDVGEPQRTCVGCRRVAPKREFVRLVCDNDLGVVVDADARLPGRGAYVCGIRECVLSAARGGLARSWRVPIRGDAERLWMLIQRAVAARGKESDRR